MPILVLSTALTSLSGFLGLLFVGESLPPERRKDTAVGGVCSGVSALLQTIPEGLRLMVRYPLFAKLCAVLMLSGGVYTGYVEIL